MFDLSLVVISMRGLRLLKLGWLVVWNLLVAMALASALGFAVYATYRLGWPALGLIALVVALRWFIRHPTAWLGLVVGWKLGEG